MTPDEVHDQLFRLAADRPAIYQDAWRWFLAQGAPVAPVLAGGLEDDRLGNVAHWRILLVLRDLREPSTLPAILRAFRTAVAAKNVIVLPGALEALSAFDDEEAWAALISGLDLADPDAVSHAAVLLAHKGGPRAEQAIARLLARPDMRSRQAGVAALLRIDSESARDLLARHRAIETDPDVLKIFERLP
jgi:HEAT repeat protein